MTVAALIVAAGRGERLGARLSKAYVPLAGRPLLTHALERFLAHPGIDAVLAVIDPAHAGHYAEAAAGLGLAPPAFGGATRQASVLAGLEALAERAPARVLIHDAARPFPSAALIDRVLDALATAAGVLPAVAVVDSLRLVDGRGRLDGEAARDNLVRAQTPQGFAYRPILAAHRALAETSFTDDAALARAAGIGVVTVTGDEDNFKVTHPDDMIRAQRLATPAWRWRTGTGFDVHRLVPGRPCIIGGVTIPAETGLAGHSDADVALHALTDAILGAIAAGDIGHHFPPSDPRWRDADSALFLEEAARLVGAAGGVVEHVDLTVICERPRLGPHRGAIRERIAALLALPPDTVSVKATTTERLGFTGRGEGIAAQAAATVRLPWRER